MTEQTWFRTGGWREPIEPVCVIKETAKTVTVRSERFMIGSDDKIYDDDRRDKRSRVDSFFPTWEEAYAHVLDRAEAELEWARKRFQGAAEKLHLIKGLKNPSLIAGEPKP